MDTAVQDQKTLLLTGASRGIGHATAKAFAGKGWRVIGCSRQAFSPECPWPGGAQDHVQVDLSDPNQTIEAVAQVKRLLNGNPVRREWNTATTRRWCTSQKSACMAPNPSRSDRYRS